jgi:hypothetical protein
MMDTNIYIPLWEKYKHAIINKMKAASEEPQTYKMTKEEFESVGDRKKSTYSFNLEIKNGKVTNNIGGTAVARDLFNVLQQSNFAKELMQDNYFKITLSKGFILTVQIVKVQDELESQKSNKS